MKCKAFLAVVAILPFSAWAAMDYYSSHTTQSYIGKAPSQLPEPKSTSITFSSDLLNVVASRLSAGSFDPERNSTTEDTNQKHSYTIELPLIRNKTEIRQSQANGVQTTRFVDVQPSEDVSHDESSQADNLATPYAELLKKVQKVYPEGTTIEYHESSKELMVIPPSDQTYTLTIPAPELEMHSASPQSVFIEKIYPLALRDSSLELLLLAGSCDAKDAPETCPYGDFQQIQDGLFRFSPNPAYQLPTAPIIISGDPSTALTMTLNPSHQLSFIPGMNPKVSLIGDPVCTDEPSDNGGNRGTKNPQSRKSGRIASTKKSAQSKKRQPGIRETAGDDDDGKHPYNNRNWKKKLPADAPDYLKRRSKQKKGTSQKEVKKRIQFLRFAIEQTEKKLDKTALEPKTRSTLEVTLTQHNKEKATLETSLRNLKGRNTPSKKVKPVRAMHFDGEGDIEESSESDGEATEQDLKLLLAQPPFNAVSERGMEEYYKSQKEEQEQEQESQYLLTSEEVTPYVHPQQSEDNHNSEPGIEPVSLATTPEPEDEVEYEAGSLLPATNDDIEAYMTEQEQQLHDDLNDHRQWQSFMEQEELEADLILQGITRKTEQLEHIKRWQESNEIEEYEDSLSREQNPKLRNPRRYRN